jgi:hypothetical protein
MAPHCKVTLTQEERNESEAISTKGKRAAHTVSWSPVLLLLDAGEFGPKWPANKVAEVVGKMPRSMENPKKRFVEEGLPAAIERKKHETPPRAIQFGGEFEARLQALACSDVPEGHARWTIRLLAEKMIELKSVEMVSPATVRNT